MVSWSQINPVLIALFSDLMRKREAPPDWQAEWFERRDANNFISPDQGNAIYLKITTVTWIGYDMNRKEMLPVVDDDGLPVLGDDGLPKEDLFAVTGGYRRWTLQVQAWETEHTDEQWSLGTLETLRTRLDRDSSRARLLDVNVNLEDILASRKLTQTIGGRRMSISSMDCIFVSAFSDVDPVPVGWIQRIGLATAITAADGAVVQSPPNSDETIDAVELVTGSGSDLITP